MPQLRQCLNVGEVWVFCALLINMRNDCVCVCNYTKRLAFILVCETHLIHYSSSCPSLHSCLLSFLMDQDQMLTSIIAGIVFNCANCTRQAAREAMLVKRPSGWEPLSRSTGNWNLLLLILPKKTNRQQTQLPAVWLSVVQAALPQQRTNQVTPYTCIC